MVLGLGTGSTVYHLIVRLGELVQSGMKLTVVATSKASQQLALQHGVPLLSLDEAGTLDLCIDGVDEIDPEFNAVKGGGGALFRE